MQIRSFIFLFSTRTRRTVVILA